MSMQYCHNCNTNIDTDYDAEHFDVICSNCGEESDDICVIKEQCEDCDPEWLKDK